MCLTACPAKDALTWAPFEEMKSEQPLFDDVAMNETYLKKDVINDKSVKNVQFAKPYFQFSAACAGCAETTYIKLVSQLFGDRLYVATPQAAPPLFPAARPSCPIARIVRATAPRGSTLCLRTTAEFAYASSTHRMPSARSCSSVSRR